jgi:hypothetical protein
MARDYGISTAAMCKILKRVTWAIDPEPDALVVCPALQFVPAIYARSNILAAIILERGGLLSLPKSSGQTERRVLRPEKPTRRQKGRDRSSVVLTKADARMIRHRADCPKCKPFSRGATMAREYGVNNSAISIILSGKTWKGEDPDAQPVICPARQFVPAIEAETGVLIEILRERGDLADPEESVAA